jgi:hypothetical protein|eukprot:COSAG06_NODE_4493_length_4206_cov_2.456294_3_plen_66_part_00
MMAAFLFFRYELIAASNLSRVDANMVLVCSDSTEQAWFLGSAVVMAALVLHSFAGPCALGLCNIY